MNSLATVLEEWSRVPFAPGKRRCRELDVRGRHRVERQKPTLGYPEYVWQYLLGKTIVEVVGLAYAHSHLAQ